MKDPATMTIPEIEAELADLAARLRERDGPQWLLNARLWRLNFERMYKVGKDDGKAMSNGQNQR